MRWGGSSFASRRDGLASIGEEIRTGFPTEELVCDGGALERVMMMSSTEKDKLVCEGGWRTEDEIWISILIYKRK